MPDSNGVTIIRKKKVIAGGGHHGGAWKVAYADFVTAMMAFFLLMWLLNATTEQQRKGLADYFNPSIPILKTSGGGDGPFGGDTPTLENTMIQNGTGATRERPSSENRARGQSGTESHTDQISRLEEVQDALAAIGGESEIGDRLLQHIRTRLSRDGLVIEVFDLPGSPLFVDATDVPSDVMYDLLGMIAEVSALVTNDITVSGHLSAAPLTPQSYDGWALSSDRALVSRSILIRSGLMPPRFIQVSGQSDRVPSDPDIFSVRNRRIEVTLRRSDLPER